MSSFERVRSQLFSEPKSWLVTGVAGFIGSNVLEALLKLNQNVVGLDSFATGRRDNLTEVKDIVATNQWARFTMIEGDIRDLETCSRACRGVDYVLHQAALGSVPRSIKHPLDSNETNVNGFLNVLTAARDSRVSRFVYASSSSVYGDLPELPKVEERTGEPLSPYAVTKYVNELYARVFAKCYGLNSIGLRYFNVFGPRQDPEGAYAAVIPKWIAALAQGDQVCINGDGETSRDFCFVANVVQANLLAATEQNPDAVNEVYNIAVGERTSLNELFQILREYLGAHYCDIKNAAPIYRDQRAGDVRHSLADITKARRLLGYVPSYSIREGLREALDWYVPNLMRKTPHIVAGANCDILP